MIELSTLKIAEILGFYGDIIDAPIKRISTDSRDIDSSTAFLALIGEKFDGHSFVKDVIKKGAPIVIVSTLEKDIPLNRQILVKDTLKAFGKIAQYNRMQYKGTVIALTGSSGKTTIKEELKATLSVYAKTYATQGNFNNFVGVPMSLLNLDMASSYAIIEMGMSARHEIEYLASLTKPDIAIVTNVYPMHIEFLKTLENIAYAKAEIFSSLSPSGIALYNETTNFASLLKEEALKYTSNIYSFNKNKPALPFTLKEDAPQFYENACCCLEVAKILNLDIKKALPVIENFTAIEGRGKKYKLNINNRHITLIDDSYSGQPDAVKLAIENLSKTNGRKIALLGKMAELGDYSKTAHQEVGKALAHANIDVVIGICEETKDMLKELPSHIEQYYFPDITNVDSFLTNEILKDNDTILIKGAHYSSAVFKIASTLKAYAV